MIRLLEYVNGEVRPHEFKDRPNPPRFAILSHRWGAEEVTYEELLQVSSRNKKGYQKIKWCGEQAKADGYDYFWVDTCCIDKRNNTEYAEAINSMFRWYKAAQVCYAYLADVNGPHGVAFEKSVWFTRGWTLQELVASRIVQFYDGQLQYLGDKESLEHRLVDITKIHQDVLRDSTNLSNYSIAERMSWAANRTTERVEDRAYSMLVIFGIEDMPILYGQGETAFQRLQERIMQRSDDFSIFAWQGMEDYGPGILASKPDAFKDSGGIVRIRGDADYKLAKQMIEVDMRLKPSGPCTYVGLLPCMRQLDGSQFGILLRHFPGSKKYVRVADGDDENRWINPDQADEFLPTDRIFIYQDIEESDGTIEGIKYTQVPSMSFRISASSAVTSQQSSNVQWDKIRQTFTKPANAMPNQGIIGELELEDNKAGIKIVRVGFDKYSNPVVMIARSCGLETSGAGTKTLSMLSRFAGLPPFIFIALPVVSITRKPLRPSVHKGKGLWGYSADEGDRTNNFWDYDASNGQTSSGIPILDRNDRLGLWLLRGDRRSSDALQVTLLPNLEFLNPLPRYGRWKRMGPSVVVTIQKRKDNPTDAFTWDLSMRMEPFPRRQAYELRNQMRGAKHAGDATLARDVTVGKFSG